MSGNTTSLGVVDLESNFRAHLSPLDVEEAGTVSGYEDCDHDLDLLDIMRRGVEDCEQQHGVGDLSMEPHGFVQR